MLCGLMLIGGSNNLAHKLAHKLAHTTPMESSKTIREDDFPSFIIFGTRSDLMN